MEKTIFEAHFHQTAYTLMSYQIMALINLVLINGILYFNQSW